MDRGFGSVREQILWNWLVRVWIARVFAESSCMLEHREVLTNGCYLPLTSRTLIFAWQHKLAFVGIAKGSANHAGEKERKKCAGTEGAMDVRNISVAMSFQHSRKH